MNSELKIIRREFYRSLVSGRDYRPTTGNVLKWERRFFANERPVMPVAPRLVNHFKLGADPEFIFDDTTHGRRVNAQDLGLKTGLCAGADQNGRLVEIRPKADEFALNVLGSVLEELRWLAAFYPDTNLYSWKCSPFMYEDGLGGHVHFGRKRPTRVQEVTSLDALGKMYMDLNVFHTAQWLRRQEGDRHGQHYGTFGDYRPQIHGYEYRTLPSWLDSPWLAYFVLVTSKLVVYDPSLVKNWPNLAGDKLRLRALLAYYKGQDDDAWIAYHTLERVGLPKHVGNDFRPRWGVQYAEPPKHSVELLPTSIAATPETVRALFDHLVEGKKLEPVTPVPNWSPTHVPPGFRLVLNGEDTHGKAGYGELLWDACCLKELPVRMDVLNGDDLFRVGTALARKLPVDWKERLQRIVPDGKVYVDGTDGLYVGKVWRTVKKLQLTRKALFSGVFPLWRLRDANETVKAQWLNKVPAETEDITGTLLYPTVPRAAL